MESTKNQLYSTTYFNSDGDKRLTDKKLFEWSQDASEITIFSAYYSIKFLQNYLSQIKNNKKLKKIIFVFNAFGGLRLSQQVDELKGLQEEFNNLVLDIYLNSSSQIFHTKLYGFKTNNETYTWLVGSANLSFGGFENNEEILYRATDTNIERTYVDEVIDKSDSIKEDIKPGINNLVNFFRDGVLYHKPDIHSQMSFNLEVPDWINKKITLAYKFHNSISKNKIGPYNTINGIKDFDANQSGQKNKNIGHLAIYTSYGLWVPTKYINLVESKIKESGKSNYDKWSKFIASFDKEVLKKDFKKYIKDINKFINEVIIPESLKKGDRVICDYGDKEYYLATVVPKYGKKLKVEFDDGTVGTIGNKKESFGTFDSIFNFYIYICTSLKIPF
jgi:hypothetical protein